MKNVSQIKDFITVGIFVAIRILFGMRTDKCVFQLMMLFAYKLILKQENVLSVPTVTIYIWSLDVVEVELFILKIDALKKFPIVSLMIKIQKK